MQVFQSDWQDADSYAKEIRYFFERCFFKRMRHLLEVKIFWSNELVWILRLLNFFFLKKTQLCQLQTLQLIYWGWGRRWEGIWVLFFIWFWDWLKSWVCWRCCLKYIKKINLGQRELFFIWFFWSGTSQMPLLTWQSEDWAWIMALLLKTQSSSAWLLGHVFPFRFGALFV